MARLDMEKYEQTAKAYESLMRSHDERVQLHKQELIAKNVNEIQRYQLDRKLRSEFEE